MSETQNNDWRKTDKEIGTILSELSEKLKIVDDAVGDITFNITPPPDFQVDVTVKF